MGELVSVNAVWRVVLLPHIHAHESLVEECIVLARWHEEAIDVAFEVQRQYPRDDASWPDFNESRWFVVKVERIALSVYGFDDSLLDPYR